MGKFYAYNDNVKELFPGDIFEGQPGFFIKLIELDDNVKGKGELILDMTNMSIEKASDHLLDIMLFYDKELIQEIISYINDEKARETHLWNNKKRMSKKN